MKSFFTGKSFIFAAVKKERKTGNKEPFLASTFCEEGIDCKNSPFEIINFLIIK